MKTLLVLRHAKSSWQDAGVDDHDRPLNARGARDAPRMGALIRRLGLVPDLIVSSTATRARMTAEDVAHACGYPHDVSLAPGLYLASPSEIVRVVRTLDASGADRVLIVGHNPGFETLVARAARAADPFPTAALAQIDYPIRRWQDLRLSTRGRIVSVWRPKELPVSEDGTAGE